MPIRQAQGRPARILTLVLLATCLGFLAASFAYLLLATSIFAQEILLTPPNQGNFPTLKAADGAAFNPGWNFFVVGHNECTTLTVLNELQADGGSALEVNAIFVKEFLNWQTYTFQSPKQKKIGSNDLLAFNSNQKFFLQIDEKACTSVDSARQKQIEKVRESQTAKNDFLEKVSELPVDLWTKLTNILNREGGVPEENINAKDNLIIGGKTIVNDLGITGKVTAGLLTINGFSDSFASLNTLSDDLYLQNQGVGGINILNGKFTIDKTGNVKITKLNIDEEESSIGGGTIQSGSTSVFVSSPAVTSKSRIFITPTSETGGQSLIVKSKTVGKGFTVLIEKTHTSSIAFDWWIVN